MRNYADEATALWHEHEVLETAITKMSAANKALAKMRAIAKVRRHGNLNLDVDLETLRELAVLNAGDIQRSSLIDDDKFLRDKANTLALLALVHGHEPTKG